VVVIESPRILGAMRLHHVGRDPYDARFELLCTARRACPDAAIVSADGALEDADFEWRLEMRGVETNPGDLGMAVHRELSVAPAPLLLNGRSPTHSCLCPTRWADHVHGYTSSENTMARRMFCRYGRALVAAPAARETRWTPCRRHLSAPVRSSAESSALQ
jgi:hypothetical protein